jgi:hypothetical protein
MVQIKTNLHLSELGSWLRNFVWSAKDQGTSISARKYHSCPACSNFHAYAWLCFAFLGAIHGLWIHWLWEVSCLLSWAFTSICCILAIAAHQAERKMAGQKALIMESYANHASDEFCLGGTACNAFWRQPCGRMISRRGCSCTAYHPDVVACGLLSLSSRWIIACRCCSRRAWCPDDFWRAEWCLTSAWNAVGNCDQDRLVLQRCRDRQSQCWWSSWCTCCSIWAFVLISFSLFIIFIILTN